MKKLAAFAMMLFLVLVATGYSEFKSVDVEASLNETQSSHEVEVEKPVEIEDSFVIYDIKGTAESLAENTRKSIESWRKNVKKISEERPETVVLNGPASEKLVSLTFDDGPDSKVTPKIIEILNEYDVVGNFFFIGQNIRAFPNVVQAAYDSGHLILGHSYNHANYTNKSYEFILQDIQKTNAAIQNVIGIVPTMMRPPYGVVTESLIDAAEKENQQIIIWSTDTLDWSQREVDNIVKNVLENVRPGEIVLMHSIGTNEATAKALPEIIEGLMEKGYRIVGLDELLK